MFPVSGVSLSTSNFPKTLTTRTVEFEMINFAMASSHAEVNLSHLLCALFTQTHGYGSFILKDHLRQKFKKETNLSQLKELLHLPNSGSGVCSNTRIIVSDSVNWVLNEASRVANELEQKEIGSGEILVALLELFDKKVEEINPKVQGIHAVRAFFHHLAEKQYIQLSYPDEIELLRGLLGGLDSEKVKSIVKSQYDRFSFYRR